MGSDGKVRKGWQTIGGKRYYMGTSGAAAVNKFMTIDGAVYYFGKGGAMLSGGDYTIENRRYRFGADGKMVKEINCHLDANGEPVTGWHERDGSERNNRGRNNRERNGRERNSRGRNGGVSDRPGRIPERGRKLRRRTG